MFPKPHHRKSAIVCFARVGYAARGIVYLLVGGLTTLAVFGQGGQTTGSRGALKSLLTAPLGRILLLSIAVGLMSYAFWRCVQAVKDTDHHGKAFKGLMIRSGLLASALSHMVLAAFSVMIVLTIGGASESSGSGSTTQSAVDWLMAQPFGRWLVGIVGITVLGIGVTYGVRALKTDFDRYFTMPTRSRHWAFPMFRFGLAVRGIVFIIVGTLFVTAAYQVNPEQAGGTTQALQALREQPFGKWLLATVAVGLFAFGVYGLLEAMYRQVDPSSPNQ